MGLSIGDSVCNETFNPSEFDPSPVMTCPNSSSGVSPKKGTQPTRNSYRMMPIAHQSTGFP